MMAEKADGRFWVLGDISESLISLSGTCPNSAFPVTLGCEFPLLFKSHWVFSKGLLLPATQIIPFDLSWI